MKAIKNISVVKLLRYSLPLFMIFLGGALWLLDHFPTESDSHFETNMAVAVLLFIGVFWLVLEIASLIVRFTFDRYFSDLHRRESYHQSDYLDPSQKP